MKWIKCDAKVRLQIEKKYGSSYEEPVAFFKLLEMMDSTGCLFNPDFTPIANSNEELKEMEEEFDRLWEGYRKFLKEMIDKNLKEDTVTTIKTEFEAKEVKEEKIKKEIVLEEW